VKKILYLILHTEKHSDRWSNLTQTWLKGRDYLFYSDHQDDSKNILKVTSDNTYHSNEPKFVNVVTLLPEKYMDYEWYFFVDNDTWVNSNKLEPLLDSFDTNVLHGSKIYCWPHDKTLGYLSGGAGILIHNSKFKHLRDNFKNYKTGYSDVSLGYYMRDYNVECVDNELFKSQSPSHYEISEKNIPNYITFHYIKDRNTQLKYTNLCKL